MNLRIVALNITCFCGAYWLFLSLTQPSSECLWFRPAVYGSFAIAIICYLLYTYQFLRHSQQRWLYFIHLIIAGFLFFASWSFATITSIRIAMHLACPNILFSAHTSGTQFDQYKDIPFFLIMFAPMFALSMLIDVVFQIMQKTQGN